MPDVGAEIAVLEKSDLSEKEKLVKKDELMRDYSIKSERIHSVNQLLKAYTLFEKDVEYVLMDNKVKIVDEQTGRIMDGRRYSDTSPSHRSQRKRKNRSSNTNLCHNYSSKLFQNVQ